MEGTDAPPRMGARGRVFITIAFVIAALIVLRAPVARLFGGAPTVERVSTTAGQRRTVGLRDGTRVDLGVETTLAYPARPAVTRRSAVLEGQAYFSVPVDSLRPFAVTALHAGIETSGAQFAVRARDGQAAVRVVVAEGTVKVRLASAAPGSGRTLTAGQAATIAKSGAISRQDSVDVQRLVAWRNGRIIFAATPLREALAELSRWHGVELRIADSVVANRQVTAEFATTQTITEMLDQVALSVGAVYQSEDGVIIFRRER